MGGSHLAESARHQSGVDSLAPTAHLTADEIEQINANGPFSHSIWRGRGVTVTGEEGMAGRVEFLSARIRETIRAQFSDEELARMSIVDVGCNDGWMLESLSDLPFARMVGVEPRAQTVARGRRVREILRIPSRVEYRVGRAETLDEGESFDIVLCLGVLHHVEALAPALQKLRAVCRRMIVLDTVYIASNHLTPALKRDVELKDVVYRYKPSIFGITAQKYEGHYYPGSGVRFSIVNIPTFETLQMHLDMLGFGPPTVLADWNAYRQAIPGFQRPAQIMCVTAMVAEERGLDPDEQEAKWIEDYERRMTQVVLPVEIAAPLYRVVCADEPASVLTGAAAEIHAAFQPGVINEVTGRLFEDPTQREIVASMPFCPMDKVRLEYAKLLLSCGEVEAAIAELHQITRRVNADWRACYRAFYLLWRAALVQRDEAGAEHYRTCCLTCNPQMPLSLLARAPDMPPWLRRSET